MILLRAQIARPTSQGHRFTKNYMSRFEAALETVVFKVLNSKTVKSKYKGEGPVELPFGQRRSYRSG